MSNLADMRVKGVPLTLDKERHLKFDLNAFAELEDKYGSVADAMKALEKGSVKAIRALLWAGLIHEDENLTERMVGGLIGMNELDRVTDAISAAIESSLPEQEEEVTNTEVGTEGN